MPFFTATIDLYAISPVLLEDKDLLHRVLVEDIPRAIHMTVVAGPLLEQIDDVTDPLDAGLSGVVVIATSHIAAHLWPADGMANISICSCTPFDAQTAVEAVRRVFHSDDVEVHTLVHATRWTRHLVVS